MSHSIICSLTLIFTLSFSLYPISSTADTGTGAWHKALLPDDRSPVDLSFLNRHDRPAGRRGFVRADGNRFLFGDGSPARFWGVNLQAAALFATSDKNIKKHAKRIARMGCNLVRIHHHDSAWVIPNIFSAPAHTTQTLSEERFRKLDLWISSLKQEGVYIWLDLHVGRAFTGRDGIEGFSELSHGKEAVEGKGFCYINPTIQACMQTFNANYMNHINRYTRITWKDDPAVVAVQITNENDLSHHFGNLFLPNKGFKSHARKFEEAAKQFAVNRKLKFKNLLNTWKPGESKIFLNELEHQFNIRMIEHLRKTGVRSLVVTTNFWGGMGLSSLPSLTDGEIVDVHSYGGAGELAKNPRTDPGFLAWIGTAQVAGKPLTVSEWNLEPFPVEDRFTVPINTAAIASLQDWDALILYGYSQKPLNGTAPGSNYSSFNDPSIMGLMPATALLYRQRHVAQSRNEYELAPARSDFFFANQTPATSRTIRTLLEISRFSIRMPETPELPWLANDAPPSPKALIVRDMDRDFIPAGQSFVVSDTGELRRDWVQRVQTVDTPQSQIAAGSIGGKIVKLSNALFQLDTKQATVAVQSLDNHPIAKSNRIFITVLGRSQPDLNDKNVFLSEPVSGTLSFIAPPGLKLYPSVKAAGMENTFTVKYSSGRYMIRFKPGAGHWFTMR